MLIYFLFFIRSKDDPFVLYAAMYSGLGTKILTRDLMRSQKYLLDVEMKSVFQKWLQKHRLVLKTNVGDGVLIKVSLKHGMEVRVYEAKKDYV